MSYPFVVLEGVDGVGKTTITQLLASQLNAIHLATPQAPFSNIRAAVEELRDPTLRFHFYLTSVIAISLVIERRLATSAVVCDRYVHSTIAYHKVMGVDLTYIEWEKLPIIRPTATFLLTASKVVRNGRTSERTAESLHDHAIEKDYAFLDRVNDEFLKMGLTVVDTSNKEPAEVVQQIMHNLRIGARGS